MLYARWMSNCMINNKHIKSSFPCCWTEFNFKRLNVICKIHSTINWIFLMEILITYLRSWCVFLYTQSTGITHNLTALCLLTVKSWHNEERGVHNTVAALPSGARLHWSTWTKFTWCTYNKSALWGFTFCIGQPLSSDMHCIHVYRPFNMRCAKPQ